MSESLSTTRVRSYALITFVVAGLVGGLSTVAVTAEGGLGLPLFACLIPVFAGSRDKLPPAIGAVLGIAIGVAVLVV